MSDTLVIVTENDQLGKLVTLLKLDQASLRVIVVGERSVAEEAARIAATVKWIDTKGKPAEGYAAAVAQAVEQAAPKVAVAVATPGSRAALGMAACKLDEPVVSNVISMEIDGDTIHADHMVLDNKVIETVEMPAPAVALVDPLSLQSDEASKDAAVAIEEIAAEGSDAVELESVGLADVSALQDAEVVVSVGKGIANGDAFEKAKRLASAIDAEMGCSMPVAKELGLLPHERYVGMSGKHIEPRLYIALGISGLPHHTLGVKNARSIVVVNKDSRAFFFENADYGIVGDVNEVIPELERALKAAM